MHPRQCGFYIVDRVDDIGARLLEDQEHDRGLMTMQRAKRSVLRP